jgi:SAM-dependent methyltransferase
MLPRVAAPAILDIGCGQGGPTLELSRLSGGWLTGLDIDQSALDVLAMRAAEEGLADRVRAVHGSMTDLDFSDGSFDIIWAEGSMHVLGFERALAEWRRFIRPDGFLVVHEMAWLLPDPPPELVSCPELAYPGIRTVPEYARCVPDHGYLLLGHFALPDDFWLLDYFEPMLVRLRELRVKYADDQTVQRTLDREERAANLYRRYRKWYGSAFLVMQKTGP